MNQRSLRNLGIVAILLIAGVVLVNTANDGGGDRDRGLLLPDLKVRLNDVAEVTVTAGEDTATVRRDGDRWVVANRGGYPADTGMLREALLALADAEKLEAKTANPERYEQLGLAGDELNRVQLAGDGVAVIVDLGSVAQGSNRYARIDGEDQAWLIDSNPTLPAEASEWLRTDLVDIKADAVRAVTIAHDGGDTIRLARPAAGGDLAVENLPAGRELSYASVVNPIGGALGSLRLEDVRAAEGVSVDADVTAEYRTGDGLVVTVSRYLVDDESWFGIDAEAAAVDEPAAGAGDDAADSGDDDAVDADDAAAADDETPAPTPAERAASINATTAGWLYSLPGYKQDQFVKTWSDLLKPLEDEAE